MKEELEMHEFLATHLHNQTRKRKKKENGHQATHKMERGEMAREEKKKEQEIRI